MCCGESCIEAITCHAVGLLDPRNSAIQQHLKVGLEPPQSANASAMHTHDVRFRQDIMIHNLLCSTMLEDKMVNGLRSVYDLPSIPCLY